MTDSGSGVDPATASYTVLDEYQAVQPTGPVSVQPNGSYTLTVQLQASRRGNDQDGRHYTIEVSATDKAGNRGSASATVTVPAIKAGEPNPGSRIRKVPIASLVMGLSSELHLKPSCCILAWSIRSNWRLVCLVWQKT
jgi:Bacterial Ig-like domain